MLLGDTFCINTVINIVLWQEPTKDYWMAQLVLDSAAFSGKVLIMGVCVMLAQSHAVPDTCVF